MKTHKILLILFAAFTGWCGTMNAQDADLKKRMKDADPKVIGTRIVNKFLITPHTRFGNRGRKRHPTKCRHQDKSHNWEPFPPADFQSGYEG